MFKNAECSRYTHVLVDLADMKASNSPSGKIITSGLGACMAVAIYDPVVRVGGMLHFMLPDSQLDRQKAMTNPFLFADTGIPLLFRRAYKLGAVKERILCWLAGASNVLEKDNFFNVGELNHLAAREILSKNSMPVHGECIGGHSGKTITLVLETGRVVVTLLNGEELEI